LFDQEREDALARGEDNSHMKCPECRVLPFIFVVITQGEMDMKKLVSLESFMAAHCPVEDDADSYDGSASEAEEDDEWLFADERKRKGKQPAKAARKKKKPVIEEDDEDWVTSAKVDKLCEILEGVRANDPAEKVIVFSQVHPRLVR
jgi:hypothetical protein